MGGENAAVGAGPGLGVASSTTAPAPSPNSTQVVRSVQSSRREKVSAPITSARRKAPVRSRPSAAASPNTKPEHTACTSKAAPPVMPSAACTVTAVAGKVLSGVDVASTMRSMLVGSMSPEASAARAAATARSEVSLARRGDPALADAGALGDPVIGGVDLPGEIGVGEDVARQVAPTAEHDRTRDRHVGTLSATGLPTAAFRLPSVWEILACNS